MGNFGSKLAEYGGIFVILLVTAVMYFPSLSDNFVWDDYEMINYGGALRVATLKQIFYKPFATPMFAHLGPLPYYRPICILSWKILYQFFGLRAFYFRMFNLFVYFLCIVSLWFLARRFVESKYALLSAAVFAFHPVHIENVAFVSGLSDILAGLFVLWSFYALVFGKNSLMMFLGSFFLLLAFLSKESAIAFLPAIFIYDIGFSEKKIVTRQNAFRWFLILSFLLIYFLFRSSALGENSIAQFDISTLGTRVLFAPYVFIKYVVNMLLPMSLAPFHPDDYRDWCFGIGIISWIVCIALTVVWFALYKRGQKTFAYFSLWVLLFLLPVVGVVRIYSALWAERFAFISSIGFSIVMGSVFAVWERFSLFHSFFKRAIIYLYLLFFFTTGMSYSFYWSNNWMLHYKMIETAPDVPIGYTGMAKAYADIGYLDSAYFYAHKALSVRDTYFPALVNLGDIYVKLGKIDSAVMCFKKAARVSGNEVMFYTLNAHADIVSGDYPSALEKLMTVQKLFPDDARVTHNMGLCYLFVGDTATGRKYLELAHKLRPEGISTYFELKKLYIAVGDTQALAELERRRLHLLDE